MPSGQAVVRMEHRAKNGLIYIKLVLTALFWGGIFIAGRSLAKNVGPFSIAFIRFVIASICLVLLTLKKESKLPRLKKDQLLPIFLLGMTGIFAYNAFFFKGLQTLQASRASVIIATTPVFIALFSSLIFRETLTGKKIFGIIISVAGAVTVLSEGKITQIFDSGFGSGELYIFGCVIFWTTYSLIGKKTMAKLSPLVCVTYSSLVGTVALLLPAYFEGVVKDLAGYAVIDWLCIAYIAFFGTVLGFVWFYEGVNKIGPTKAGLFINFVPVFAITLSIIILKEPVTLSLLIGGALVCTGVYLVNKAPASKKLNSISSTFA
jgi:drug/metabolite transporter (DMT)-like permease